MKVVIPIPEGLNSLISIAGTAAILESANTFPGEHFELQIAALKDRQPHRIGRYTVAVDLLLEEVDNADLILIPALVDNRLEAIDQNAVLIEWLQKMYARKTQIGSICTGAYLLAATGLLDGKQASSHWSAIDELRVHFPQIEWVPERIITDSGGIYTSGGTFSSFNLILYLVEKFVDKATARRISKILEIDYPRQSQVPFMIFNNQKKHHDERILRTQIYMEQHLAQRLNVEDLASRFGMSRRNFIRRFKQATNNTPHTYLQRLRIEEAKRLFETTEQNVSEVMFAVGYADVNTFRQLFQRYAGFLPSHYRRTFGSG